MNIDYAPTRAERRATRTSRRRAMHTRGASVRLLQQIILRRAAAIDKKGTAS